MRLEAGFASDFPHWFLAALNARPIFIPTFVAQERIPAPPPLEFRLVPKDDALHRRSQEAFLARLRGLAEKWIETGREAPGEGEDPTKRKLDGELWHVVNDWWVRNPPDVLAASSGEPTLSMPHFKVNFTGSGVPLNPVESAGEEAVRWFAWFLALPHRYRLCRCRSCGEYYYTQRKPKGRIEFGTYCARHRHRASATRSNELSRGPAHERRLEVASKCWGQWPKRIGEDEGRQAQWIARKVNDTVSPKWTRISRNWVTLHRAEIERRSRALTSPDTTKKTTKGKRYAKG